MEKNVCFSGKATLVIRSPCPVMTPSGPSRFDHAGAEIRFHGQPMFQRCKKITAPKFSFRQQFDPSWRRRHSHIVCTVAYIALVASVTELVHMEILRRGPRAWNAWREKHPSQNPILDYATLGDRYGHWWATVSGSARLDGANLAG